MSIEADPKIPHMRVSTPELPDPERIARLLRPLPYLKPDRVLSDTDELKPDWTDSIPPTTGLLDVCESD